MAFQDLVIATRKYFPNLQVKYKDQSTFMKILALLFFFNRSFMTDYITTIGNTIYIPTQDYIKLRPISGAVIFMHELVHMYDQKRIGNIWFQLAYMLPQILILPALLLFLLSWKIAIPVIILLALPIPAYFRMYFERRAYVSSVYVIQKLSERLKFNPRLDGQNTYFIEYFIDSSYYFMWPFTGSVTDKFNAAAQLVQDGRRPYQDPVFDILDDLVTKV
jgi:hypothetical protein